MATLDTPTIAIISVIVGLLVIAVVATFATKDAKTVDVSVSLSKEQDSSTGADTRVVNPIEFRPFKVLKITKISHNTKLIRFEIPHGKSLGLTVGKHISVQAEIDGKKVMRAYTPTSRIDQAGYFDLLVKSYEFGKMSRYLNSVKVGQSVQVRGPVGRFKYSINSYPRIGLIAGGTGLTPCLQVMRTILCCPSFKEDRTCFTLFFQNRAEEDILLAEELQQLQAEHRDRLQIFYFLSNPRTASFASVSHEKKGYIKQEHVAEFLSPSITPLVCICGPSGFNTYVKDLLVAEGHTVEQSIFIW